MPDTDSLHTQVTNTVPCTGCAKVEVPAPVSIEEDPLCGDCLRGIINAAADKMMAGLHDAEMAAGHVDLAHDLDPMDWHMNYDPR